MSGQLSGELGAGKEGNTVPRPPAGGLLLLTVSGESESDYHPAHRSTFPPDPPSPHLVRLINRLIVMRLELKLELELDHLSLSLSL